MNSGLGLVQFINNKIQAYNPSWEKGFLGPFTSAKSIAVFSILFYILTGELNNLLYYRKSLKAFSSTATQQKKKKANLICITVTYK